MFYGENRHSLDAKGRLIVPAKYREKLGDIVVLTKGFDGCLCIYSNDEWNAFAEKLLRLPQSKSDARKLTRFFLSSATEVEIDKQGRIVIPSTLRIYAELTKDVVVAGAGKKIEVWNLAKWETSALDDNDNIETAAENLSELGIEF